MCWVTGTRVEMEGDVWVQLGLATLIYSSEYFHGAVNRRFSATGVEFKPQYGGLSKWVVACLWIRVTVVETRAIV